MKELKISNKKTILQVFYLFIYFLYFSSIEFLTAVTWEKVKKLILAITNLSDSLERLMKIIAKIGLGIYAGNWATNCFGFCANFGVHWNYHMKIEI